MEQGYIYIMTNKKRGTLYIGVTRDLRKRIWEHKNNRTEGFTSRYKLYRLVYYEIFSDIRDAINREKRLKDWNRNWKIELIEKMNPDWKDLWDDIAA